MVLLVFTSLFIVALPAPHISLLKLYGKAKASNK
jgi:hypothetical protein